MTMFKSHWYDKTDKVALGAAMRHLRKRRRVKADAIAKYIGVVPQVVCNYEAGRTIPNFLIMIRYLKKIGFTVQELENEYHTYKKNIITDSLYEMSQITGGEQADEN